MTDRDHLVDLIKDIVLIPGAGEFVYDTIPIQNTLNELYENSLDSGVSTLIEASVSDLKSLCTNIHTNSLVCSWFGSDLRIGSCTIHPKVENPDKITVPYSWSCCGMDRSTAVVLPQKEGSPIYGGTPSDASIVRSTIYMKTQHNISTVFYPFIMMDIMEGNTLPNPYSSNGTGVGQYILPWRGRITCHPAPNQTGTVDNSTEARNQVNSFFGTVEPEDIIFSLNSTTKELTYDSSLSSLDWCYRKFVYFYAKLCKMINDINPGTITGFLIGSELRGITTIRGEDNTYPSVEHLVDIAEKCKTILGPDVLIVYAADWTEYFGHDPQDGSGDFYFHLDDLWSNPSLDRMGIDYYAPISDWRYKGSNVDSNLYKSIYDVSYLQSQIEGGEKYDYYYASDSDRLNQIRSPITDGGYNKPWVYRPKDIRNWISNLHYNRIGYTEVSTPTSWTPNLKKFWLTEYGVASIDKSTNQPNVFYDPKSSENATPYYSNAEKDYKIQYIGLYAFLSYWEDPIINTNGFIDKISIWAWDARPYPDFPQRTDLWSDWENYQYGHWIEGKLKKVYDMSEMKVQKIVGGSVNSILIDGISGSIDFIADDEETSIKELLMRIKQLEERVETLEGL